MKNDQDYRPLLLQNQSFWFFFSNADPHFTTPQKHDFSTYPFVSILEKSLNGDMLTQQQHPFSVKAGLLREPAQVSYPDKWILLWVWALFPLGLCVVKLYQHILANASQSQAWGKKGQGPFCCWGHPERQGVLSRGSVGALDTSQWAPSFKASLHPSGPIK